MAPRRPQEGAKKNKSCEKKIARPEKNAAEPRPNRRQNKSASASNFASDKLVLRSLWPTSTRKAFCFKTGIKAFEAIGSILLPIRSILLPGSVEGRPGSWCPLLIAESIFRKMLAEQHLTYLALMSHRKRLDGRGGNAR